MGSISRISDVLSELAFDENARENSIKKAIALSFWKDIAGSKFANFSMPYDIKGKTLFVTVKNPQVMQELIFYKTTIISKIRDYFLPLNIQIEEIRYDYKAWNKIKQADNSSAEPDLEIISSNEIEKIPLDKKEEIETSKITDTISKLSFLDENRKKKYIKNIINSIKAKKLRGEEN